MKEKVQKILNRAKKPLTLPELTSRVGATDNFVVQQIVWKLVRENKADFTSNWLVIKK